MPVERRRAKRDTKTNEPIKKIMQHVMEMSFVGRVYTMLEDAKAKGFDDVIRWEPDGTSFKVHKVKEFESKVQPNYLKQTRMRSFQRKLIAHGFASIPGGPARGAYRHDKFLRDHKELCQEITTSNDDLQGTRSDKKNNESPSWSSRKRGSTSGSVPAVSSLLHVSKQGMNDPIPTFGTAPLSKHFIKAAIESQPPLKRETSVTSPLASPRRLREDERTSQKNAVHYQCQERNSLDLPLPVESLDDTHYTPIPVGRTTTHTTRLSSMPPPAERAPFAQPSAHALPAGPQPDTFLKGHFSDPTHNSSRRSSWFLMDEEEDRPPASVMVSNQRSSISQSLSLSLFSMDLDDIVMEEDGSDEHHLQAGRTIRARRSRNDVLGASSADLAPTSTDNHLPPSSTSRVGDAGEDHPMAMNSGILTSASIPSPRPSKDSLFSSINGGSWCDRSSNLSCGSISQLSLKHSPPSCQAPLDAMETLLDKHVEDMSSHSSDPFTPRPIWDAPLPQHGSSF